MGDSKTQIKTSSCVLRKTSFGPEHGQLFSVCDDTVCFHSTILFCSYFSVENSDYSWKLQQRVCLSCEEQVWKPNFKKTRTWLWEQPSCLKASLGVLVTKKWKLWKETGLGFTLRNCSCSFLETPSGIVSMMRLLPPSCPTPLSPKQNLSVSAYVCKLTWASTWCEQVRAFPT